ncbi:MULTISPECIES: sugar ABC transporter ATP-binding protein [Glycomyces]|uniref:Simple sugar transport system ATP-binding protein n=2 Tax=Glycomyces TaxID=58113 RepID=A0A9X3T8Q8_9ACTN|nr:sugar ABC transporter ATP-binding protein [Glycomyces lechevalierae]MDA1385498.1 sugar ABC transporter ATP-binding protein [Glycomyces lechevalierae]MDR7339665.1 simple sugar transport system ATP-binding protein [Glycomyces lechevalierae]
MSAALVSMTGIVKDFTGVRALDGVDFTLRPGEIHAVMGENGAGKSTLIKVLTGVHAHDAGEILLDGKPVRFNSPGAAQAAGIATVYQEVNLTENLSVAENLLAGREPRLGPFINFRAMRRKAKALLDDLGIDLNVAAPLSSYSIAMQQLVAIARAVDIDAKVLILDEPTSSLDRDEVAVLLGLMRRLAAERGTAMVFISHFLEQVYDICDRMTVLRNGKLVGEWATADLPESELIGHMLGREAAALEQLERSVAGHEVADEAPLLSAKGLGRKGSIAPYDLDVRRGEVVGLAGLLGSGRTETVRLIAGADRADSGSLSFDGAKVAGHNPRTAAARGIAFCPENRKTEGLVGDLTVAENMILAMQAARGWARTIPQSQRNRVVAEFIDKLGIRPGDPDMPVKNLSGGNQQKVLLARWMLIEPKLLILDEPTRGIDVGAKADIQKLVAELSGEGMAVLFVSAELDEVTRLSDRIAVLRDRELISVLESEADMTTERIVDTIVAGGGSE